MCPSIASNFQLNMKVEEAYTSIWKALLEITRANIKIVREIPAPSGASPRKPSYVFLEYKTGLTGMSKREIELRFERARGL